MNVPLQDALEPVPVLASLKDTVLAAETIQPVKADAKSLPHFASGGDVGKGPGHLRSSCNRAATVRVENSAEPAADASDTSGTGVSSNPVPALTPAVATDLSDMAHGTSDSAKKDSQPINTPIPAEAMMGETPVQPVPARNRELLNAEDDFDNVAVGSAWDV